MQKINTQAALLMDDETFRRVMVRSLNQIMDALAVGVVHENKVTADRAVDQVYNDLPVSVIAEMIDEEYQTVVAQLGLETEKAE
ncbi:hypothetical protein [Bacilliculturomica massiliensis]|uniref:hypothetical protein n=1 Tax=Bacilliculturomica massiliensis TaxID=1917867 RepID=UPI00102F995E|nr:hypothetical protein [Bacilliculturomica massiliensis]